MGKKNMKYEALMLSLLILGSLAFVALPRTHADILTSLLVVPRDTTIFGPCVKSKTFVINVLLWNMQFSGVDVYAFDFYIDWFAGVSLVSAMYHSPWASFFELANGTSGTMTYHLALVAMPPSTGLFNVNASVLTLTFHVDQDVCWPNTVKCVFHIHDVKMSSDGTTTTPIVNMEIDDGTYEQCSVQPNIDLTSTDANSTGWIIEKCNSHTFDVEVDLTNITDVYGFCFTLKWCPCELETDPQKVTFKAAFPPPYDTSKVCVGSGYLTVTLTRPSEKPTVCGALVPAVDVVFHTNDTFDGPGVIPTARISSINITDASVYAKCPSNTEYDYGCNDFLLYGGPLSYYFKPSRYDLNLDCVVDVQDMKMLVPYYGKTTCPGGYGDIFNDGAHLVDVYDFVAIAKHAGPIDP
jgi:hypothetical protein